MAIITLGIYTAVLGLQDPGRGEEPLRPGRRRRARPRDLHRGLGSSPGSWFRPRSGRCTSRTVETAPFSGWTGLWLLLPIVGAFVWFIKIQGALNRYWESKGTERRLAADERAWRRVARGSACAVAPPAWSSRRSSSWRSLAVVADRRRRARRRAARTATRPPSETLLDTIFSLGLVAVVAGRRAPRSTGSCSGRRSPARWRRARTAGRRSSADLVFFAVHGCSSTGA